MPLRGLNANYQVGSLNFKLNTNMNKTIFLKSLRNTFAVAATLISLFSASAFAQSVVITPKKVTYNRPAAIDLKSFDVTYPKVKAATSALSKKIENTLNYEKVFPGLHFKEQFNKYANLSEADYEIKYNKHNLLVINLWYIAVTSYPTGFGSTVVVNLETGERIRPRDVFTNLNGLAAMVNKSQQAEIKKAREDYKKDPENADFDGSDYFKNARITVRNLEEFSINDKGVTFLYDYEFPHIVLALQPDGKYFYSWAQLKPYIKRGSLLQKFVR